MKGQPAVLFHNQLSCAFVEFRARQSAEIYMRMVREQTLAVVLPPTLIQPLNLLEFT